MRRGDEVRFGIEVVGGMPAEEVGVGERAELPAFHKGFQLRLHRLEAVRRRGARGNGGTDFGGLDRIGLKRAGHVHEVEGVQMVEMHNMVVQILHPEHEVPDVGGVLGDFHLDRVFEGAGGGQRVGIGAHAAGALREVLHVAGVAPDQNRFKAAVQGADAAGFADAPVLHFHFNAQVAFDTGQGIDDDRSGEMALGCFSGFAHGCSL